ncbi:MAG: magnesium/cobalt transporter CorA [Blastocatellia bacterium]
MFSILTFDQNTKAFSRLDDPQRISGLCAVDSLVLWVDICTPTEQDFGQLARQFAFHPLAMEDCQHGHQRPKMDEYQGYYFMVLYEAAFGEDQRLELRELNIFLGPNYMVTVHQQKIQAIETADRVWRGWTDVTHRGTGLPTYLLIDAIVDGYLPLLDTLSERLEQVEARIFEDFQPEAIEEIIRLKKQLLFLRRAVTPLRDVFNTLLRREQPVFSRETLVYFHDVFDHLIRVSDTIDTLRDLLGSTMDAYLSLSGNRMNVIMKRLTALSTMLMSSTLVAGIYGMNFREMPELQMRFGYPGALMFMLAIAVAIYFYFRRIKWL